MDYFRWMLGQEAQSIYAVGSRGILAERGIDCFDAIQAIVQFESTFVTFESSWILPNAWPGIVEFEFVVNGSEGRLGFDGVQTGLELSSDLTNKHMFSRPQSLDDSATPRLVVGTPP